MAEIPKWLQELRQQEREPTKGSFAALHEVAQSGESQTIAGVTITPEIAKLMLRLYDRLSPVEQEQFAAHCNEDLGAWAARCMVPEPMQPLVHLLYDLLFYKG